ncbi:hypothetical protein FQA39_LY07755 [Lamprigera yunnana]|nr:hypothetical protein FQA39_LY07755 [Lamprigera yunnana]
MSEMQIVYPPNRPMERVLLPSNVPMLYKHLYFLDINDDQNFILGSSNVVGAYWESTLFWYEDTNAALRNDYCNYYISPTTTSDAIFIPKTTKIVLAEDTGHIRLLNQRQEEPLECVDFENTNSLIEQLAVWNSEKILSCGERYVTIWKLQKDSIKVFHEYKDIHTDNVTSVTIKANEDSVFATSSMDGRACLWDNRMEVPAIVLYQNEFSGLSSIGWNTKNNDLIAVGSVAGDVYNLDTRQFKEFVNSYHCFDGRIRRIRYNPSGYLAVCGDNTEVIVLKGDNFDIIAKNNGHSEYVRDLAWFKDTLFSCGFDKKVTKYSY